MVLLDLPHLHRHHHHQKIPAPLLPLHRYYLVQGLQKAYFLCRQQQPFHPRHQNHRLHLLQKKCRLCRLR